MEKNIPLLYYTPASAPCRSVLMVAAALRLKLNLKPLNLMEGDHLRPTFLRISPHHTVPTLVDNEFSMFESRAICIYLVEKYGKNDALYPKNAKTRATINQLIYFDMGTLFKRFYDYFMPMFQGAPADQAKLDALREALGYLDTFLNEKKFAVGYRITIADLILLATVSTFEIVGIDLTGFRNVGIWYDNMKSTAPGWQENLKGLEGITEMMSKMMPPTPVEEQVARPIEIIPEVEAPIQPIARPIEIIPDAQAFAPPIQVPSDTFEAIIRPIEIISDPIEVSRDLHARSLDNLHGIQAIPEIEQIQQGLQTIPEFEPAQSITPAIEIVDTSVQQITPLIEVTAEPIKSVTEVTTTTTTEVTKSEEGFTEVITEVKEIITTTEQITEVTKVLHTGSETKTEVVNGAIELVENGKYEGEEVKI